MILQKSFVFWLSKLRSMETSKKIYIFLILVIAVIVCIYAQTIIIPFVLAVFILVSDQGHQKTAFKGKVHRSLCHAGYSRFSRHWF